MTKTATIKEYAKSTGVSETKVWAWLQVGALRWSEEESKIELADESKISFDVSKRHKDHSKDIDFLPIPNADIVHELGRNHFYKHLVHDGSEFECECSTFSGGKQHFAYVHGYQDDATPNNFLDWDELVIYGGIIALWLRAEKNCELSRLTTGTAICKTTLSDLASALLLPWGDDAKASETKDAFVRFFRLMENFQKRQIRKGLFQDNFTIQLGEYRSTEMVLQGGKKARKFVKVKKDVNGVTDIIFRDENSTLLKGLLNASFSVENDTLVFAEPQLLIASRHLNNRLVKLPVELLKQGHNDFRRLAMKSYVLYRVQLSNDRVRGKRVLESKMVPVIGERLWKNTLTTEQRREGSLAQYMAFLKRKGAIESYELGCKGRVVSWGKVEAKVEEKAVGNSVVERQAKEIEELKKTIAELRKQAIVGAEEAKTVVTPVEVETTLETAETAVETADSGSKVDEVTSNGKAVAKWCDVGDKVVENNSVRISTKRLAEIARRALAKKA